MESDFSIVFRGRALSFCGGRASLLWLTASSWDLPNSCCFASRLAKCIQPQCSFLPSLFEKNRPVFLKRLHLVILMQDHRHWSTWSHHWDVCHGSAEGTALPSANWLQKLRPHRCCLPLAIKIQWNNCLSETVLIKGLSGVWREVPLDKAGEQED